jgi:anti-anti-sigma factor
MALKVTVTEDRSFSRTVHLDGRLDNDTAEDLDKVLDALVTSPANVLVFDLAHLEYISSAGLRSIFRAQRTMAGRSGRIVVVNARPQVQKVFEIVRAGDLASIFTSIEELDDYLDAMQQKIIDGGSL